MSTTTTLLPSKAQTERDHRAGHHETYDPLCPACERKYKRTLRAAERAERHWRNDPATAAYNIHAAAVNATTEWGDLSDWPWF